MVKVVADALYGARLEVYSYGSNEAIQTESRIRLFVYRNIVS